MFTASVHLITHFYSWSELMINHLNPKLIFKLNNVNSAIRNSYTFWSHFCLQVICIFKTILRIFTATLHFLTYVWQTKHKGNTWATVLLDPYNLHSNQLCRNFPSMPELRHVRKERDTIWEVLWALWRPPYLLSGSWEKGLRPIETNWVGLVGLFTCSIGINPF